MSYGHGQTKLFAKSTWKCEYSVGAVFRVDHSDVPKRLQQITRIGRSISATERGPIGKSWRATREVSEHWKLSKHKLTMTFDAERKFGGVGVFADRYNDLHCGDRNTSRQCELQNSSWRHREWFFFFLKRFGGLQWRLKCCQHTDWIVSCSMTEAKARENSERFVTRRCCHSSCDGPVHDMTGMRGMTHEIDFTIDS